MGWSRVTWDAEGWRSEAACRDIDADLFFPTGVTGDALDQIERAKRVCSQCPVAEECLIFAVTTNQEYGVWGGLDEEERRDVRRRWRSATRKTRTTRQAPAATSVGAGAAQPEAALTQLG